MDSLNFFDFVFDCDFAFAFPKKEREHWVDWEEILEVLKEEKEYYQNILYENVKKK